MTPREFSDRIRDEFADVSDRTLKVAMQKVAEFTPAQRSTILQALLQSESWAKFAPRMIEQTAFELGFRSEVKRGPKDYTFDVSRPEAWECDACEDTGMRFALVEPTMVETETGGTQMRRQLVTYLPPSKAHTPKEPGQYNVLGRCDCAAGDRQPSCLKRF